MKRVRPHAARGFSLVEVLASLLVFSLVTLGLIPLILTSIRGTSLSRSSTVGKNVAVEAMERARGLPYFISFGSEPSKVDLLDLYYPAKTSVGTGTAWASNTFTTDCPAAGAPACPTNLPDGYSLRIEASFVKKGYVSGGSCLAADPTPDDDVDPPEPIEDDCFIEVTPPDGYVWNQAGNDEPAGQLMLMTMTASWTFQGSTRESSLTSLVSDRKFGGLEAKGRGEIDHLLQVLTGYRRTGNNNGDLIATIGGSRSEVEVRRVATAEQSVSAALIRLVDPDADPDDPDLGQLLGESLNLSAPPDQAAATNGPTAGGTLTAPPITNVASIGNTSAGTTGLSVTAGEPTADGFFNFTGNSSAGNDMWVDNDLAADSTWRFDTGQQNLFVKAPGSGSTFGGDSSSTVNPSGSGITSTSDMSLTGFRLFPLTSTARPSGSDPLDRSVVAIENFTASTECEAVTTGNPVDATASATFGGTLSFWTDTGNDASVAGSYERVALGPAFASAPATSATEPDRTFWGQLVAANADPLSAIKSIVQSATDLSTGLVFDSTTHSQDIYLFPVTHTNAVHGHNGSHLGYLVDWEMEVLGTQTIDDNGALTAAEIDGAVTIDTESVTKTATNQSTGPQALSISLGSLSCRSEDFR